MDCTTIRRLSASASRSSGFTPTFILGFDPLKRAFIALMRPMWMHLDLGATRAAEKILTLSPQNPDWIHDVYGCDSTVVKEGLDVDHFRPSPNGVLERRYAGKRIVPHGTDFTATKGTDHLLRAMRHPVVGFNDRLTNLQAALGVDQLEQIDTILASKRRIAAWYAADLAHVPAPSMPWAQSACWMSTVKSRIATGEMGKARASSVP